MKDKLRSQLDAALSGDAMMASGLRRLSLAASTPGSGSKSMRKCQSARGPGPSLPWRSAQKEAQVGGWAADAAAAGVLLTCAALQSSQQHHQPALACLPRLVPAHSVSKGYH